jgi:hypothetical protein
MEAYFFELKGPAADTTDARQPEGLFCNAMKEIRLSLFFHFNGTRVE